MKRTLLLCTLSFLCLSLSLGQELPKIIPSNPQVAAFGKYGDIPVGHYTGVPSIQVPLVALKSMDRTFPVSLSYHASGIRVNEFASNVGLGWVLNVGGAISRSVRGIPDDYVTGFLNPVVTVSDFLNGSPTEQLSWITQYGDAYDFESDVYNFSFPGASGKFFFKQDGEIVTYPKTDYKIDYHKEGTKIVKWVITAPDGTKYYFGRSKDGQREAMDTSTVGYTDGTSLPDPPQSMEDHVTSWKLMDVETIGSRVTSLDYAFSNVSFWNLVGQQKEIPKRNGTSSHPLRTTYAHNNDKVHRLVSVYNDNGRIVLEYNKPREDLKSDYALTGIKLKDVSGRVIDAYRFGYGYFNSTSHPNNSNLGDLDQRRKRLYLKNVEQTVHNETNRKYAFAYDTAHILPDRFSYSQDFWGYYNGRSNTFFYPQIAWRSGLRDVYTTIVGGDRKVDGAYARSCVLRKITYPTGGHTEFDLEPNRIGNVGFFGLTETEIVPIDGLSTVSSGNGAFEKEIVITDAQTYTGIFWRVNMDTCQDPNGLECPKAELYKYDGTAYKLISATHGAPITEDLVMDSDTLRLKIKLYDHSDAFPPDTGKDITASVSGRKLKEGSGNAILAGGLRVKSIKGYDADNVKVREREYLYRRFDDPSVTSGAALNPPTFIYENMPYCTDDGATAGPMDLLRSNSIFPLSNGSPYTTCYLNVTELFDNGNNGKNEYTYNFVYDGEGVQTNAYAVGPLQFNVNTPLQDFSHRRGALLDQKTYARTGSGGYRLEREVTNKYNPFGENLLEQNIVIDAKGCFGGFSPYKNLSERFYRTQQKVREYHDTGELITTTDYTYDTGYSGRTFPTSVTTGDSNGNILTTRTYFPDDVTSLNSLPGGPLSMPGHTAMLRFKKNGSNPRIGIPLQTSTVQNGKTMVQRTIYKDWGNGLLLPQGVQIKKDAGPLEDRVEFLAYDGKGNPLEVKKTDGPPISYVYGYNGEYPVAKVENATRAQVLATGADLSVLDDISSSETARSAELDKLRNGLPDAMVTTYTYDPLVGMTRMTDPRGHTTTYHYDPFNRLKEVRDDKGKLMHEYQYNYKDQ